MRDTTILTNHLRTLIKVCCFYKTVRLLLEDKLNATFFNIVPSSINLGFASVKKCNKLNICSTVASSYIAIEHLLPPLSNKVIRVSRYLVDNFSRFFDRFIIRQRLIQHPWLRSREREEERRTGSGCFGERTPDRKKRIGDRERASERQLPFSFLEVPSLSLLP